MVISHDGPFARQRPRSGRATKHWAIYCLLFKKIIIRSEITKGVNFIFPKMDLDIMNYLPCAAISYGMKCTVSFGRIESDELF